MDIAPDSVQGDKMDKCYSTDEERFYDDADDVIQDYTSQWCESELVPGATFAVFVGDVSPVNPSTLVSLYQAEALIESAQQELHYIVGDCAEDWLYATNEQVDALHQKLQAAFVAWLREHGHMRIFYRPINIVKRNAKITAVDDYRVEWEWVQQ